MGILITIDNGGTFTDACVTDGHQIMHTKTLTTPYDLSECFSTVLRQAAELWFGSSELTTILGETEWIRYSSTVGTNALVQRKGPRLGVMVDEDHSPEEFTGTKGESLWESLVGSRVVSLNNTPDDEDLDRQVVMAVNELLGAGANRIVVSFSGEEGFYQEQRVKRIILRRFPRHMLGAVPVLYSHELTTDPDLSRRTWTALFNSFLHPEVERFLFNAETILRQQHARHPLLIFQNDGNSSRVAKTVALKTYSSGPRGGLEGARALARHYGWNEVVTMDVGGTTTDYGVIQGQKIQEHLFGPIEAVPTSFTLANLRSIGAGGSSVVHVNNHMVRIGPDSVGALPGPACFGRGGEQATVTDAWLVLGLFNPESYFGGHMRLDRERASRAIARHVGEPLGISTESAAAAVAQAFEEILAESLPQGSENTVLLAFGGAGPISACGVADKRGIKTVVIPRLAPVFSAFGITFSDLSHSYEAPVPSLERDNLKRIVGDLKQRAERDMFAEGFGLDECEMRWFVFQRQSNGALWTYDPNIGEIPSEWTHYKDLAMRLEVTKPLEHFPLLPDTPSQEQGASATGMRQVFVMAGDVDMVPVYTPSTMAAGSYVKGPALIEDEYYTGYVPAHWQCTVNVNRDLVFRR